MGGRGAATVAAAWGALAAFNDDLPTQHRGTFLVAVVTAAAVLAIGYIIGSDVRGRAAASVATMEGRAIVARAMIEAAVATRADPDPQVAGQIVSLPSPLNMRYHPPRGDEELGWKAVALRVTDKNEYLLIKGGTQVWAGEADVELT